jgi:hypothetical protein
MAALAACSSAGGADTATVVASYGTRSLFASELQAHMPTGATGADSARFARQYVAGWLQREVLAEKALAEVTDAENGIADELEDYRRERLAQRYLAWQVERSLDTAVAFQQIDQYYKEHPEQFQSASTLYQFYFLRTSNPESTPQLRERLASDNTDDRRIIIEWAREFAQRAKLDQLYYDESVLLGYQPEFSSYSLLQSPARGPVVVQAHFDSSGNKSLTFCYIRDIIPAGQPKPLENVAPDIRNLILAQRRAQLIDELRTQAQLQAAQPQ